MFFDRESGTYSTWWALRVLPDLGGATVAAVWAYNLLDGAHPRWVRVDDVPRGSTPGCGNVSPPREYVAVFQSPRLDALADLGMNDRVTGLFGEGLPGCGVQLCPLSSLCNRWELLFLVAGDTLDGPQNHPLLARGTEAPRRLPRSWSAV